MFFRGDFVRWMGEGDGLFASSGARARLAGEAIVSRGSRAECGSRWEV